jgi:hypothetical protein
LQEQRRSEVAATLTWVLLKFLPHAGHAEKCLKAITVFSDQ